MIAGGITYHIGSDKYASSTGFHLFTFNNEMLVGGLLIGGGALTTIIGIPLFVVGSDRKYLITGRITNLMIHLIFLQ
jgi:hypothetical protein